MEPEPAGLLGDADRPRQLVGADTVLAVGEHPERGQPLVEANRAILEDRAELDRELPPTVAAFPDAAGVEGSRAFGFPPGGGSAPRPSARAREGAAPHLCAGGSVGPRATRGGRLRVFL